MAWIKLDHATLDKPEVSRFADLLNVSHGEGIALLLRFWIWMDNNAASGICPGNVRHMSAKSLDRTLHCPGFSGALQAVGWLEIDAEGVSISVPNFDTHNGTPAKTRASDAKRKGEKRLENVQKMSGSKPDQIRIDKRSKELQATAPSAPTDEHRQIATELKVDCDVEFAKYTDHFAATGKPHKDAVAGFRNWLRRAAEYRKPGPAPPRAAAPGTARQQTANAIFGEPKHELEPTDITGQSRRLA